MIDFLKRLLGIKPRPKVYLTELKPCPFCGGRHIQIFCGILFHPYRIVCNDCRFRFEGYVPDLLIRKWESLPRKEHTK